MTHLLHSLYQNLPFFQLTNIISLLKICIYFYKNLRILIPKALSNKDYSLPIQTSITLDYSLGCQKVKKN